MSEKDFGREPESFADLERSFESVLSEIVSDRALDSFRAEYERLHAAFVDAHSNNESLVARCRDLNDQISSNSAKVQEALRLSQQDQRTIGQLRNEFERAWRSVEALRERESKTQDVISALKHELQSLADAASASDETESRVKDAEMKSLKDEVTSGASQSRALNDELSRLAEVAGVTSARIAEAESICRDLDAQAIEVDGKIGELDEECARLVAEIAEAKRINAEKEKELADVMKANEETRSRVERLRQTVKEKGDEKGDVDGEIGVVSRRMRVSVDILKSQRKENEKATAEKARVKEEVAKRQRELDAVVAEMRAIESERAANESEAAKIRAKHEQIKVAIEAEQQKVGNQRREIVELARKVGEVEESTRATQRGMNVMKRKGEITQKQIARAKKDAVAENRKGKACRNDVTLVRGEIARAGKRANELDAEISQTKGVTATNRTNTNQLRTDKEENIAKKEEMERRMVEIAEQTKQRARQVKELRTVQEMNARQMVELGRETDTLKADLKYLKANVKQQKELITKTDTECMEIHTQRKKTERKVDDITNECSNLETKIEETMQAISALEMKKMVQVHLLQQSDEAVGAIKNEIKRTRESMRTQEVMVGRRVQEAGVLRSKVAVIENQFRANAERWEEVSGRVEGLKQELGQVVEKMDELRRRAKRTERLKRECLRLEKELLGNQMRAKALEDESEVPMGIHRWRLLESTNPELAQLVHMRTVLMDRLAVAISKMDRFVAAKREKQRSVEASKASLKRRKAAVASIQSKMAYEKKIQAKTKRLESMVRESLKRKSASNTWLRKINGVREEVVHEKEQFYITKLKEVPYATVVKEPPVLQFTGGQTPRAMIPKLRMTGAASLTRGPKSARICPPPLPRKKRVVPPLQPVQGAR